MAENNKIQAIQGLRFLFAIGIVMLHFFIAEQSTLFHFGYLGVTFFFILSGYLSANSNTSDVKSYYKKKFWHIYPIHWFAFICTAIAFIPTRSYWISDTWWIAGLNVSLLQGYYPDANVSCAFNGPAWFLCAIVLFYLLLPLFQRIRAKSRMYFYILTFFMCVISVVITWSTKDSTWGIMMWGKAMFPLVRLPECLLGMCLYDVSKVVKLKLGTWGELSALLFFIITLYTAQYAPKICLQIYWWLPVLSLIVYVGANSKGLLCKLLSSKALVGGGKMSMEIFMFHNAAIRAVPSIEYFLGNLPMWIDLCLVIMLTALLILIWHYVVEPRVEALRKKIN